MKEIKVIMIAPDGFKVTMTFPQNRDMTMLDQVIDELVKFRDES